MPAITPGGHHEPDRRRDPRPRRRQRPRRHPRGHQHRRRRGDPRGRRTTPTPSSRGTTRRARGRRSTSSTRRPSTRSGTARPTSTGRSTSTRRQFASQSDDAPATELDRPGRHRPRRARRSRSGATRSGSQLAIETPELEPQPVHARRAGRAGLHGQDRRDRAVDRRQVLRRHPGDGRGPPRRGVRQVPRHQARRALPDQRPPAAAARRHHRRQPLGHDLPRHADHGRGPGPRRLRLRAPDHPGPAAQAAPPLRDERRGPPRGLRRAVAEGVLRRADRRRDARAPGVRLRGRRPHARPLPAAGGVGAHGRRRQGGHQALRA